MQSRCEKEYMIWIVATEIKLNLQSLLLNPDIGALAKKSNDNALSLVFKIANE